MRKTTLFLLFALFGCLALCGADIVIDSRFTGWVQNKKTHTFLDKAVKVSSQASLNSSNTNRNFSK